MTDHCTSDRGDDPATVGAPGAPGTGEAVFYRSHRRGF